MIRNLPRLARTLRPLHPSQLVWRGRYALERRLPAPHIRLPVSCDEMELRHLVRAAAIPETLSHLAHGDPSRTVARLAEGRFHHLHLTMPLGRTKTDWRLGPQSAHRLWTITLHYHEWLHDLAVAIRDGRHSPLADELFTGYLLDWMQSCDLHQPGARDLAWNSYAIATRIGWWIRAYRMLGAEWWSVRSGLHGRFLSSLWRQAEFLSAHPEWDLRGNHILRNAVGLAWAGRFFNGDRPRSWMSAAETIAADQIDEQILPDGGHFERSPMYHAHVLDDVRALEQLVESDSLRIDLGDVARAMTEYASWMRHPDGDVALFNDGALTPSPHGFAGGEGRGEGGERFTPPSTTANASNDRPPHPQPLSPAEPGARGAEPRGARYFSSSGYCVWHGYPWSVFVDVGEVGPDCQPGHAHADTLSLECSFRGERLFVDPGTHSYDDDTRRRYDRSTAAHNTVCIDGRDSSEMWHVFRVGARARPTGVRVEYTPQHMAVEAAHTGYDGLAGSPRHWRRVVVTEAGDLTIVDRITGGERHAVAGGWLLAPGWTATPVTGGWDLIGDDARVAVRVQASAHVAMSVEPAPYHPEYGLELTVSRLVWRHTGDLPLEITTRVTPIQAD